MATEEDDYHQDSGTDGMYESADSDPDSAATDRRKHYKILQQEDIERLQENDISAVSAALSVPRALACTLLCRNKWSRTTACEEWFAAADGDTNPTPAANPANPEPFKQICKTCAEDSPAKEVVSAGCGHSFCADCWKSYIAAAVSDGAACLTLHCPESGCRAAVTSDMVEKFASETVYGSYQQYLRQSYVELNPNRKWCPSPGCDRAVELDVVFESEEGYDVVCDCLDKLCWRCGEEWHHPVDCKAEAEWLEKKKSEAESTMWILDNTKPCPRCGLPIQEHATPLYACSFMTCIPPCSFNFCWKCTAPWRSNNERCFDCDKSEEDFKGKTKEEIRGRKAKRFRDRYVSCYERWEFNDRLRRIGMMVYLDGARRREVEIKEMKFLAEAWENIVEWRRVLKWSYVYGYYKVVPGGGKAQFLERLQGEAEEAMAMLHHCVERDVIDANGFCVFSEDIRVKLWGLTLVASNCLKKLVMEIENGSLVSEEGGGNLLMDMENYDLENDEDSTLVSDKEGGNLVMDIENYDLENAEESTLVSEAVGNLGTDQEE